MRRNLVTLVTATLLALPSLAAQDSAARPNLGPAVRRFVRNDAAVIVLRHARVIDGTGARARAAQMILIRDGVIRAIGPDGSIPVPTEATQIDLEGRTVIPGLVMVHEHLYYPTGGNTYANLGESFTRLYLAGGVTSMRTGGNMNGHSEINFAKAIARGEKPGPWIDATAPYLTGPGLGLMQLQPVRTPNDARKMVAYWADAGATSFKTYMHITRDVLSSVVSEAHSRGFRVTGHLCSVTYNEAAEIGIDNLEHGFFAATDFVPGKRPDECRQNEQAEQAAAIATSRPEMQALIANLVRLNVAVTSTLTIFETFVPGRPLPPGLDVLEPSLRADYQARHAAVAQRTSAYGELFKAGQAAELAFHRAGGLLVVGTDPTGGGGVVPGYSNQRALELLVEGGFTPLEAITIGTLNGARYLRRDREVGTIAVGKQADLVVLSADPSTDITNIRKVELVFRQGVAYDPAKLIESVKGKVGLW
jgi:imidazolonepropionase-like amidohydrolase